MKHLLFLSLSSIFMLQTTNQFVDVGKPAISSGIKNANSEIKFQDQPRFGRMSVIEFKSQKYCRVELEDFEFDAHFSIVSATVYFSGTNFKNVEKGIITSSSLKSIGNQMERCSPGTIVVFDNVKVIGPDKEQRTIPGVSLTLY